MNEFLQGVLFIWHISLFVVVAAGPPIALWAAVLCRLMTGGWPWQAETPTDTKAQSK